VSERERDRSALIKTGLIYTTQADESGQGFNVSLDGSSTLVGAQQEEPAIHVAIFRLLCRDWYRGFVDRYRDSIVAVKPLSTTSRLTPLASPL
jgi:hypothetical protein